MGLSPSTFSGFIHIHDIPPPSPPFPASSPNGFWLVGSDGGIFDFGRAPYYGSTGSLSLQRPVVGITPTATGAGYWLVASDGGVFSFGDATFEGSCPGLGGCFGAAVAVMPDATGHGYWLVTQIGVVYDFGDAPNLGPSHWSASPIVSPVRTPDGLGYWLLAKNGTVTPNGDAPALGSATPAVVRTTIQPPPSMTPLTVAGTGWRRPVAVSTNSVMRPLVAGCSGLTSTLRSWAPPGSSPSP